LKLLELLKALRLFRLADKEITLELKRSEIAVLLVFLTFILVLELQVTFGTPISFGDEGFHTRMGQWIAQNVEYPVWVPFSETAVAKTSFERQPFWNILEAGFFFILGFNEGIVKFLVPMISMLIGIAVYLFAKRFYNWRVGLIAAIMVATIPSFVTYSVLFYTDALMTFFLLMFVFMFSLAVKSGRRLHMMTAGAFGALAFMTKLTGYIVYVFIVLIFLYYFLREKKFLSLIKRYSPLFLMLVLIPSTIFIRNYRYYNTPVCYRIPLVSTITDKFLDYSGCSEINWEPQYEYEGRTDIVGGEADVFRMGLVSYLEFAYGNIWLVVFAVFAGTFLILSKIGKINTILLVMAFLYIPLFFSTVSRAEDTARYALMWAPIFSVIAGKYFNGLYNIKPLFLSLTVTLGVLLIGIWMLAYSFPAHVIIRGIIGAAIFLFTVYFLFKKNYKNALIIALISLILIVSFINGFSKVAGMAQVKQFSPLFFEACDWMKENTPEDSLVSTVWTHRVAYSCQRSITASLPDMALSNNVTHILSTTKELGITHIFIQKFSLSNEALSEKYPINYVQLLENNPDHFKKIFENGLSLDQCVQQGGCDGNIIYEIVY